ncbi:MAG: beta-propeller domain-containing protein [Candidatus Nanoarchaeia archaeon]
MKDDNDKFILIDINDERSKTIAEILGNKTSKAILDYLSETKEASEQDIAKALSMPINTVEYNLNKLIKSGLVEKAKNFFWSVKGRKIDMFKLAKKHIIISPKSKRPDMNILKTIVPVLLGIALIAIIGIYLTNKPASIEGNQQYSQLKNFNSVEEMQSFLKSNSESLNSGYYGRGYGIGFDSVNSATKSTSGAAPSIALAESDSSAQSAGSYSETNVQVEGVDEPDIVKNDGKYIYTLSGNRLFIVNAYPAEEMNILSEINISNAQNIFINKDKLIVFANSYENFVSDEIACFRAPCYSSESFTKVYIYDISNRKEPILKNNFSVSGNYYDSRMINDYVYVISNKYIYDNYNPPYYVMNGVKSEIALDSIYYFGYYEDNYVFNTISSINLNDNEIDSKVFLTGGSSNLYVSENNIYLANQKTLDFENYTLIYAEDVALPLLSGEYDSKVEEILEKDEAFYYNKLNQINKVINEYLKSVEQNDLTEVSKKYESLQQEFNKKISKETEKTQIHKISFNEMDIEYKNAGEVPGHLLNQFSMDEYGGNLRVATTTGNLWNGDSLNHVYILDEEMQIIGKLEDLAQGEKIYSARFLKDRAYVVTFKKIDPLFVIDLKDPLEPKVLGYLKIPGYSDYLHPYDENHIIGIGKDAVDASEYEKVGRTLDFAWYQGVKVALFDVSDFENPREISKLIIGDRGTESPALYDHKAFLFDKEKGIIVMPITLAEIDRSKYQSEIPVTAYGIAVWQGAYVLNINLEDGISLRGKITHTENKSIYGAAKDEDIGSTRKIYGATYTKTANNSWEVSYNYAYDYYMDIKTIYSDDYMDKQYGGIKDTSRIYDYKTQVQRSLYMDNVLYTISQSKVKANELESLEEINKVDLPQEEDYYGIEYATY